MDIDTSKKYFEDFINQRSKLKGFVYVFSTCHINPYILLYKYAEPIEVDSIPSSQKNYLVPVEIEIIKP